MVNIVFVSKKDRQYNGQYCLFLMTDNTMANIVFVSKKDRQYNGQYCLCF